MLCTAFFERVDAKQDESQPSHLYIALTSDRGLCGGVHSSISKRIRALLQQDKAGTDPKLICIGDKSKTMLQRSVFAWWLFGEGGLVKVVLQFTTELRH